MKMKFEDIEKPKIEKIIIVSLIVCAIGYIGIVVATADRTNPSTIEETISTRLTRSHDTTYRINEEYMKENAILTTITLHLTLYKENVIIINICNKSIGARFVWIGISTERFFIDIPFSNYHSIEVIFLKNTTINFIPISLNYTKTEWI